MSTATASSSKYGRVFDGNAFQEVTHPIAANNVNNSNEHSTSAASYYEPVPPITKLSSNDKSSTTSTSSSTTPIFVSIPHFRDGKRCAQTLRRIFELASFPDRVTVGLIEQTDFSNSDGTKNIINNNDDDDPTCLMEYCALMGYKMKQRESGIIHMAERQSDYDTVLESCPRVKTQIRSIRFHHWNSKGPVYARSFTRRLLADEEFCMEIDASMDFVKSWDEIALRQWKMTNNEYAILSNVPLSSKKEKEISDNNNAAAEEEVPRECLIKIGSEGVPLFGNSHPNGKAIGLTRPLVSRTYSPSFTFAKCHYQTNVPQDPFAVQLLETERFPHFARLWTRGYDVYTPTSNIVFKDNSDLHPLHHTAGHGDRGEKKWPRNDIERRDAHVRMKVMLNIHHGITNGDVMMLASTLTSAGNGSNNFAAARANLGIYGLGRRRTLEQLLQFAGIALPDSELRGQHGNEGRDCANLDWVPYDKSVSPRANLFDGTGMADDLDLEPDFPLRTVPDDNYSPEQPDDVTWKNQIMKQGGMMSTQTESSVSSDIPYSLVFLLWVVGLYAWYSSFVKSARRSREGSARTGRGVLPSSKKPLRKAIPLSERALKNV